MPGKKYHHFKDDTERTHAYAVISVVDDTSDAEKFEAFVSKAFMRSHLVQLVRAINKMSDETLHHIEEINERTEKYTTSAEKLKTDISKAQDIASDAHKLANACVNLRKRRLQGLLDTVICKGEDLEELGPDFEDGESEDADPSRYICTDDADTSYISSMLDKSQDITVGDLLGTIAKLRSKINTLESRIIQVESSEAVLAGCATETLAGLKSFHEEYKDRIKHRLNKETKDDSTYLFNMYLTFKSKHYNKLAKDFKTEHPRESISGLKVRGAHKTYAAAEKQAELIAKDDDFMDTYICELGKWIAMPIRTDYAETITYREKELNDLLGSRLEETERIKHTKRNKSIA